VNTLFQLSHSFLFIKLFEGQFAIIVTRQENIMLVITYLSIAEANTLIRYLTNTGSSQLSNRVYMLIIQRVQLLFSKRLLVDVAGSQLVNTALS